MKAPVTTARPAGVIDTLSAGYDLVNRRPWVLLLPVLLDLFLWLGPQVSYTSLVGRLLTVGERLPGASSESAELFDSLRRQTLDAADSFNALDLLALPPVAVPSVGHLLLSRGGVVLVESWAVGLVALLGIAAAGLLIGSCYYGLLAWQVRQEDERAGPLAGLVTRAFVRVVGLLLVLAGVGLALGLPLAFLVAAFGSIQPELGVFAFALGLMGLVWLQVYLFFAPDAIFISDVGPLRAVQASVAVVRKDLWAVIRLLALTWLILLGMGQVWAGLSGSDWGALLSILGNAYITSGLVAASMVFYRERSASG